MATVSQSSDLEAFAPRLPLFDGFPYFVTRIVGPLCHVTILPADRSEEELRHLAGLQVFANRLETCLVLGADRAIFYDIDAAHSRVGATPRGGILVAGKLRSAEDFPPTPELLAREERLRVFIESHKQTGYLVGNSRSAYRPATAEEISGLSGRYADGVPPDGYRGVLQRGTEGYWGQSWLMALLLPMARPLRIDVAGAALSPKSLTSSLVAGSNSRP